MKAPPCVIAHGRGFFLLNGQNQTSGLRLKIGAQVENDPLWLHPPRSGLGVDSRHRCRHGSGQCDPRERPGSHHDRLTHWWNLHRGRFRSGRQPLWHDLGWVVGCRERLRDRERDQHGQQLHLLLRTIQRGGSEWKYSRLRRCRCRHCEWGWGYGDGSRCRDSMGRRPGQQHTTRGERLRRHQRGVPPRRCVARLLGQGLGNDAIRRKRGESLLGLRYGVWRSRLHRLQRYQRGVPLAGVSFDAAGNAYGTTTGGGLYNAGTVWEIAKGSYSITAIASFNGTDGATPSSELTFDSAGNLYGTTSGGGAYSGGTVFDCKKGVRNLFHVVT